MFPVATIVQVNGLLSANGMVPGLALYIPKNELMIRPYQIKAGDTLWGIAQRFNTSVSAILKENPNVDPNAIYIGQSRNPFIK